jgi:hypothetical protein
LLLFLFSGCNKDDVIVLKTVGGFPNIPTNLSICNSKYDDYTSDIPDYSGTYGWLTFIFSSNRNSQGKDFDFVMYSLNVSYKPDENVVFVNEAPGMTNQFAFVNYELPSINTKFNEYGPFILPCQFGDYNSEDFMFFYTQEENNRCKIKFYKLDYEANPIYTQYNLNILNSDDYNIGYLSISNNKIYYDCDIDGNYDLYQLDIDSTMNIVSFLTQKNNLQSKAKKIISSDEDDKCPFVKNDLMVFASKRSGGQGGFDLWYSKLKDSVWSEPVNFGAEINTSKDEYRPIVVNFKGIPNDLMVFSSNRDGGFGGFDLYYLGITITRN